MRQAVRFTVNGTPVAIEVDPRMTLADALRQRLDLKGTHLGCEHGVCGACTVLYDGVAARSCLLFAVQAEGSEVVTVEGFGTPDRLHPLQEALSAHHGLQCGFCTPGFLISAYELLRDHPDQADSGELARALSGVLCRCTGYRGILEAVRTIARQHPDGPPPPGNLGRPISFVGTPGALPTPQAGEPEESPPISLDIPTQAPTTVVEVEASVPVPAEELWSFLEDPSRVAGCVPGAELGERLESDVYSGRMALRVGPMTFRFVGRVRIVERDRESRLLRLVAAGMDPRGPAARADLRVRLSRSGAEATRVGAEIRLFLSGRSAQFGRSIVRDVTQRLFEDFVGCLGATAMGGQPTAAELGAGTLLWEAAAAAGRSLRALVRRRSP